MKKKILNSCITVLVGFALIYGVGCWAQYLCREPKIPTIREFQKQIGCEKIDGKLGDSWRTSETQAKWQAEWQRQNPGKYMY